MSSFYFCPASYWFSSSLRGASRGIRCLAKCVLTCVDPDSYFIHAQNRNGGARSGSAKNEKTNITLPGDAGCSEKALLLFVSLQSKRVAASESVSASFFFLIQKLSVLFYGLEQRLE